MNNEQSPIKEIWEKVKYLFGIAFIGFLFGISFLVFLAILLQWTIGIDITEFGNTYRLLFLFWGVCAVGWHLYLKNQEKTNPSQNQDTKNEIKYWQIVGYPKPPAKEELEQEPKEADSE